jgi:glutaredoxin
MAMKDVFNALRKKAGPATGSGKLKNKAGEELDLELYTFDSCPYCQRVYRAIDKLGLEGIRLRDILEDESAARTLVEVGGKDQVPCLFVNGKPMYESADIVVFLEKNFAPEKAKK